MQSQFYVARNGAQLGPWTVSQILANVQSGQLAPSDYLYDEASGDWVALMAHPALAEQLKGIRPPADGSGAAGAGTDAAGEAEAQVQAIGWYVLKGDNRFGPFVQFELIKMLQAKSLYEFDFVWRPGMAEWCRVSEAPEFSPEAIRGIRDSGDTKISEMFFRRRHARVAFGGSLIVHDNARVFRANAIEIGAGGASIELDTKEFEAGQTLFLHFKPGDGVPSFNATCLVINKSLASREPSGKGAKYGVKFTTINARTRDYIEEFANRKTKAGAAA
jgi:hypothetical protein